VSRRARRALKRDAAQQFTQVDVKSVRQADERLETWISATAFHRRDVRDVQLRFLCELLLRQCKHCAPSSHAGAEHARRI
jgi:hypothetical protein